MSMSQTDSIQPRYELGMVGLGVMGRNLLLNMADHGFPVAGYDRDPAKLEALRQEGRGLDLVAADDLPSLLAGLRSPRAVMLLVPAGAPVDAVIGELAPLLRPGDLIIDGGNSHFKDTDRRGAELAAKGLQFLGLGVSGGEEGARRGPSLMPGGSLEAYQRIRPVLEAVAAEAGGEPCVAHLGPGSAGHFVKMVHNGIEYALMELIAESYDLMKRGLGMDNAGIGRTFRQWSEGGLGGYLVEITASIFARRDTRSGQDLIDAVLGVARQNGTGMWTSQSAMELQVPVPTIDLAVVQRDLSALDRQRERAAQVLPRTTGMRWHEGDRGVFLVNLEQALHAGMIMAYAQGMALLGEGSVRYGYGLDLAAVARVWRGGCIIRAALLENIRAAFAREPGLPNLLLDPELARMVLAREEGLRAVVGAGAKLGTPIPGLMSALAYLDGYRSAWLPANLIQAQRDCFGAHTYERVDMPGTFHTDWEKA
jgi:6-phosphogluconate dehydrogenase